MRFLNFIIMIATLLMSAYLFIAENNISQAILFMCFAIFCKEIELEFRIKEQK